MIIECLELQLSQQTRGSETKYSKEDQLTQLIQDKDKTIAQLRKELESALAIK